MANETKYFKTPFAESGTRTEVPNASVGGAVGFDTGFGSDYELPQGSAGRKRIERDKYNGLHHSITKNLKQWQEHLYPTWIEDDGTGVAYSYPIGMIVNHAGINWISNEVGNQEEPGVGSKWDEFNHLSLNSTYVTYKNRTSFQKMEDTRDLRDFGGAVGATAEVNGDALDAMKAEAIAGDLEMNIKGVYTFDRKLLMNTQGLTLRGSSGWGTQMVLDAGSTDDSMIDVTARLCQVDDMMLLSQNRIGLYLRTAQLFKSDGLITKGNATGIYHEEGNSAQITKFFAESDVNGYVAEAVGEGNINGCYIQGRAINCQIGWNIKNNKAPTGPGNAFMHNMLRWTAESNSVAGIRDQSTGNKSRYNYGFLYSESNAGINFDLNKENPNWWATSNPDNEIFMNSGLIQGVYTSGNNISPVNAQSIGKVATVVFNVSGSLTGTGTSIYSITNTSGSTLSLLLSFTTYMPIGSTRTIYKLDNTNGFTIAAVPGINFVGDTGVTFGAFVNNQVEQMEVTKLDATNVLLQITPKGA